MSSGSALKSWMTKYAKVNLALKEQIVPVDLKTGGHDCHAAIVCNSRPDTERQQQQQQ